MATSRAGPGGTRRAGERGLSRSAAGGRATCVAAGSLATRVLRAMRGVCLARLRRAARAGPPAAARIAAAAGAGSVLGMAGCRLPIDSFDPVTARGLAIANLFALTLALSAAVLLLVAGLTIYVLVRYREPGRGASRERGDQEPPQIEGDRRLEIGWTVAPVLLLGALFLLTIRTMSTVAAPERPEAAALRVEVVGHQWWWEFRYPDLGVVTANELHVPVGTPLRLDLAAGDVIHSFWVPQLGWKLDAVPGRTNTMWLRVDRVGTYDGACTEFCGLQHAWMRVRLVAQPAGDFERWLQQQRAPAVEPPPGQESLVARGQQVFLRNTCVNCHTVQGTAAAGRVGPDLTHFGSRQTLGAGIEPNTPEVLRRWVQNAQSVKPGVLMPAYSFSDDDLTALVAYLSALK
jgi:cytochrome c oxidase subunit 2